MRRLRAGRCASWDGSPLARSAMVLRRGRGVHLDVLLLLVLLQLAGASATNEWSSEDTEEWSDDETGRSHVFFSRCRYLRLTKKSLFFVLIALTKLCK